MFTDLGDFSRVENGPWRSRPVARRFFFFFFLFLYFQALPCFSVGSARPGPNVVPSHALMPAQKPRKGSPSEECVLLNAGLCFILQMFNRR